MIKVTLSEVDTQEKKQFPKLMIIKPNNPNEGTIVFFIQEGNGFVLKGEDRHDGKIGLHVECWDMRSFTDYNEPITLQNL